MAGMTDYPQNFRSVRELLAAFYGGAFLTEPMDSEYTIGTTAVILGSSRLGQRVLRALSNTGTTNFAISYNPAVTISTGFLLQPGGFYKEDWYYDGDLLERPLWAISSAGGGTLHMLERTLVGA
jgi:voltage-gated potassium channel Kch